MTDKLELWPTNTNCVLLWQSRHGIYRVTIINWQYRLTIATWLSFDNSYLNHYLAINTLGNHSFTGALDNYRVSIGNWWISLQSSIGNYRVIMTDSGSNDYQGLPSVNPPVVTTGNDTTGGLTDGHVTSTVVVDYLTCLCLNSYLLTLIKLMAVSQSTSSTLPTTY